MRGSGRWRSVTSQLWVFMLVLSGTIGLLIWTNISVEARSEERDASTSLARQGTAAAAALSVSLAPGGAYASSIGSLVDSPAIVSLGPACTQALQPLQRAIPDGYLALIDRAGVVRCSADAKQVTGRPAFAGVTVLQDAIRSGRPQVGGPYADPRTRLPMMFVSSPVPSRPGVAFVYAMPSQSFFQQMQPGDTTLLATVVDTRTGLVLMRTPEPDGVVGKSVTGTPFAAVLARTDLVKTEGPTGEKGLFRATTITGTPYRYVTGMSERDALAPVRARFSRSLVSSAVLVAIVGALVLVLQRRIARPAAALRRAIEELAVDPEARPAPESGPSELVAVARAFNETAEARRRADGLSRAIVKNASEYLLVVDDQARVSFIAPAARGVLGLEVGDGVLGLLARVASEDRERIGGLVRQWLKDTALDLVVETRVQDRKGRCWDVEVRASDQRRDRNVAGVVLTCRDVTERKKYEDELAHAARHDALTGLPNRAAVLEHLTTVLKDADAMPVCVFFVDLDRFKLVNDSHGHAIGDRVLVELAKKLREVVRPRDLVGRFGGDEFVVVTDRVTRPAAAEELALRIRQALEEPLAVGNREMFVSGSVGIAFADLGDSPAGLLRNADTAMYRAKARGRNCSAVYDEAMRAAARQQLRTESDLHRALERRQLVLHFQPIVDLRAGTMRGAEALVRWEHPERGLVQPADFIGVAEETGLIVPIGAWVLEEACTWAERAGRELRRPVTVSVNVSPRQLAQPDFVELVGRTLRQTGLDPQLLCLEVTESVLVQDAEGARLAMHALRGQGVRLSIDDFGTGWSSLGYLQQLPVDEIKLDRSYVGQVGIDEASATIVSSLISMAHGLGLSVTAEGVETVEQDEFLRRHHCDAAQGYLFSRPLTADRAEAVLADLALPTPREGQAVVA